MKAILKSDRRIVVEVKCIGRTSKVTFYMDKDGKLYIDEQLEFIEYQGG